MLRSEQSAQSRVGFNPTLQKWLDGLKLSGNFFVVQLHRLELIKRAKLRRAFDPGVKWNLGSVRACKPRFGLLGEEIVDELLTEVWVRRSCDQHNGIGDQEATEFA